MRALNGQPSDPEGLKLDLPATHAAGRMARRVAHEYAATRGLAGEGLDRLVFVVGELLDNAVDHGGGQAALDQSELEGDVRVHLEMKVHGESCWEVHVEDESDLSPEALTKLLGEDAEMPDLEDPRGRGLLLLRGFADSVTASASSRGNGLRVSVHLGSSPDTPTP